MSVYLTLMPTTSMGDRGCGGTDDEDDDDYGDDGSSGDIATDDRGAATSAPSAAPPAPSAAPTFEIEADGGDRDGGGTTPTPAPTDHAEDLWDWWHQEGTPRADRAQALATGAGEYADRRFLVGTEDGVVVIDPAASSGKRRGKASVLLCLFCDR